MSLSVRPAGRKDSDVSGPECNPRDDEPIDREEYEKAMAKPPRTSRELAEVLWTVIPRPAFDPKLSKELAEYLDRELVKSTAIKSFVSIIDPYVKVKEAEARWQQHGLERSSGHVCQTCSDLIAALTAALAELEKGVKP